MLFSWATFAPCITDIYTRADENNKNGFRRLLLSCWPIRSMDFLLLRGCSIGTTETSVAAQRERKTRTVESHRASLILQSSNGDKWSWIVDYERMNCQTLVQANQPFPPETVFFRKGSRNRRIVRITIIRSNVIFFEIW